jgi:hypothetical protein
MEYYDEKSNKVFVKSFCLRKRSGFCDVFTLIGKRRPLVDRDGIAGLFDHEEAYIKNRKTELVIAHPYHLSKDDYAYLKEICSTFNLDFFISSKSFYWPGNTFSIIVARKDSNILSDVKKWFTDWDSDRIEDDKLSFMAVS